MQKSGYVCGEFLVLSIVGSFSMFEKINLKLFIFKKTPHLQLLVNITFLASGEFNIIGYLFGMR